jgi:CO dehydrogenase nickel-insertion accessory protein CooC1
MSVLENADAVLYLFECSRHSLSLLGEYKSKMKSHVVARTGYICSKYDREVVNEKRLAASAGINERSLMQFPYNRKVMRSGFDGSLEECMDLIIKGSPETLNIRPKLLEIMQFLFDSGRGQYIRGFDKWVK